MSDNDEVVHHIRLNGIDFTSEDYDQGYFDRKRNARREKKLSVGQHLTLVYSHTMALRDEDLKAAFGDDYQETFVFEDALIDLSYHDKACTQLRHECYLGVSGSSYDKLTGRYRNTSSWVIQAPNAEVFQERITTLKQALHGLITHEEGEVEGEPLSFING